MASKFTRATKSASKLRAAIFGPSGSGKTFSALRIAKGLGGKVALIDTERGSASKYADRFEFDVLELAEKSIESYVEAITEAGNYDYGTLVIDSLSHGWQELLVDMEKLARAKYRGNTWSAWSEGTPRQHRLINAILSFPGHVIATMRSHTEWDQEKDDKGKIRPVKVGLKPQQGKGIEYEFDLLIEISTEHCATISKDRSGRFQDQVIDKPDESLGRALAEWLSDGAPESVESVCRQLVSSLKAEQSAARERGASDEDIFGALEPVRGKSIEQMSVDTLRSAIANVQSLSAVKRKTRAEAALEEVTGPNREDMI